MIRAIYPGSFDPVTRGHLDIIRRSAAFADELIVAVLVNKAKNPLFSTDERVSMLNDVLKDIPNARAESFSGLLVDYARLKEANVIIRGLRMVTDFEYEMQIAQTNRTLNPGIETVFMMTSLEYSYLSSATVREALAFGADISKFVPEELVERINEKANLANKETI